MNFLEAVKAMKEGKKVRREEWEKSHFLYIRKFKCNHIIQENGEFREYYLSDIEATDWQIVEEKKTLSDKLSIVDQFGTVPSINHYNEKDVKEAIKEFIKRCQYDDKIKILGLDQVAKEIFGERLVE